ncbi:MAG TPA: YbjN domain-containing protein [Ktedonobacterales bacterium]
MGIENILDEVVEILHEADMTCVPSASDETLLVLMRDEAGNKLSAEISVHERISLLAVSALYPLAVPAPRREAIGEYVLRANSYEIEGGFDFDPDEGQLAYKVTAPYGDGGLTLELLQRLLGTSLTILSRHVPALGLVIYAGMSPVAALDTILRFSLEAVLGRANDDI